MFIYLDFHLILVYLFVSKIKKKNGLNKKTSAITDEFPVHIP